MESAFGVDHGAFSKGLGGFLKPAGKTLPKAAVAAGKRRAGPAVTGGAQTGGKYRAGAIPYKGRHAG